MGGSYVKTDEIKKEVYSDAKNLYGCATSQSLPYDETKFDLNVKLEDLLNTSDDSDQKKSLKMI